MTKTAISLAAALGFMTACVVAAAPASAGSLGIAKPAATLDQPADLRLVDHGSWKKKKYFKHKKHYGGNHYYGGNDDHYYKRHKKRKKYRRAYRDGYDNGYYDGRRGDHYYRRGYAHRPHFRGRGHHRDRSGSGYIKTPGFYFRF